MTANVGHLDRAIRVTAGIQMMALGLSGTITGAAGLALTLIGAALLVSGTVGHCWIYKLVHLNTVHDLPVISP